MDIDNDLHEALVKENLNAINLPPSVRDTVRKLWEDDRCRQLLRGKLAKFTATKIDWDVLLREFHKAASEKKNGETAVQNYLAAEANLTPGATSAVSRYVSHQIQLSSGALLFLVVLLVLCFLLLLMAC